VRAVPVRKAALVKTLPWCSPEPLHVPSGKSGQPGGRTCQCLPPAVGLTTGYQALSITCRLSRVSIRPPPPHSFPLPGPEITDGRRAPVAGRRLRRQNRSVN
jgi:hypothetical protein